MSHLIAPISLKDWGTRYSELKAGGLQEPFYGGPLQRHVDDGCDFRLNSLAYDPSPEALRLWNFLLTEEERLQKARNDGKKIVGTMKDLGTAPVLAYAYPNLTAFYPDGAWWTPCIMEMSEGLFQIADSLGLDESFCPARAMIGAFVNKKHFPIPDLLTCSVGATCDDFSAIAQRVEGLGHPILWWEIPHRHSTMSEKMLASQVEFVEGQFWKMRRAMDELSGHTLTDEELDQGIRHANRIRAVLRDLRQLAYETEPCPLPALEMLVCEMLAIHFCSDREESEAVLQGLLDLVKDRATANQGVLEKGAARIFWVNPVADLRAMNLLQECGGRMCGTEFLFSHALDPIRDDVLPMVALAESALSDPMVGCAKDRAERICEDIKRYGAEAVIISRIPGASHCATECWIISRVVREKAGLPVLEIEVPSMTDGTNSALRTRIEALVEVVKEKRNTR